ncbi:hypothetical protein N657DRAFT_641313 [Parathielavia appendiculata]|uniref:Uncharacterized protein n=1 Tax=Parathielavia appendiculata TaxID=2587402 RepID=A0AAN6Z6B1_9PEZI|nr:hypothetical protein N657DRAFT_641313 [Parathielavia appendiculata]
MEAVVTRPALSCCRRAASSAPSSTRLLLNSSLPSGTRQKSTAARTRRALNIPPHPSFLHPNKTPESVASRPTSDEIIFNPPSSAPSVFHTPFKFLPKTDPRRMANLTSNLFASSTTIQYNYSPSSAASPSAETTTTPSPESFPSIEGPPVLKPRHHLTPQDIEQMRRLREQDPVTNSVQNLARQFQCSKLFVLMCCQAPKEHQQKIKEQEEKVKARWGPRRRAAREERHRRMEMLFNGQL